MRRRKVHGDSTIRQFAGNSHNSVVFGNDVCKKGRGNYWNCPRGFANPNQSGPIGLENVIIRLPAESRVCFVKVNGECSRYDRERNGTLMDSFHKFYKLTFNGRKECRRLKNFTKQHTALQQCYQIRSGTGKDPTILKNREPRRVRLRARPKIVPSRSFYFPGKVGKFRSRQSLKGPEGKVPMSIKLKLIEIFLILSRDLFSFRFINSSALTEGTFSLPRFHISSRPSPRLLTDSSQYANCLLIILSDINESRASGPAFPKWTAFSYYVLFDEW